MKVSEVIKNLQDIASKYGDFEFGTYSDDDGNGLCLYGDKLYICLNFDKQQVILFPRKVEEE